MTLAQGATLAMGITSASNGFAAWLAIGHYETSAVVYLATIPVWLLSNLAWYRIGWDRGSSGGRP